MNNPWIKVCENVSRDANYTLFCEAGSAVDSGSAPTPSLCVLERASERPPTV